MILLTCGILGIFRYKKSEVNIQMKQRHEFRQTQAKKATEKFSFERHCSLSHNLVVRRYTDAIKLTTAHCLLL